MGKKIDDFNYLLKMIKEIKGNRSLAENDALNLASKNYPGCYFYFTKVGAEKFTLRINEILDLYE